VKKSVSKFAFQIQPAALQLGLAVRSGNTDAVKALLAGGADANALMGNGKTPLDIARVNNRADILSMF
jgi:ankyrin repeat protein